MCRRQGATFRALRRAAGTPVSSGCPPRGEFTGADGAGFYRRPERFICGLCNALVRNYFSSVGKGKQIGEPVVFQGGVAANVGIRRAFSDRLGKEIIVPEHFDVMGAIGAAILAKGHMAKTNGKTLFKGFGVARCDFRTTSLVCQDCPNNCEVVAFRQDGRVIAMFGDRCGKHNNRETPAVPGVPS